MTETLNMVDGVIKTIGVVWLVVFGTVGGFMAAWIIYLWREASKE